MRGASAAIVAAGLAIGITLGATNHGDQPVTVQVTTTRAERPVLEVHVAGWVVAPGVVTVPEGSIVADVVWAAGGLRTGARSELVNLAAAVGDGQQVVVPGPGTPDSGTAGNAPIRVNQASAGELEELPGVGPVLAAQIVAYREANGPYEQAEDLLLVPGIGEAKLALIRDSIQVP